MRRFLGIALALVLANPQLASSHQYGWTVSSSAIDPFMTKGIVTGSQNFDLYLWLNCALGEGVSTAEMRLENQASNFVLADFIPALGVFSSATFPDIQLAVGGCPTGPLLAGRLVAYSTGAVSGQICIVPSLAGNRITGDCNIPSLPHPIRAEGFGFGGAEAPCSEDLCDIEGNPVGCCMPDGTCIKTAWMACLIEGGEVLRNPSDCATGACCLPDGTCVQISDHPACGVCAALGGEFHALTECASCEPISTGSATWGRAKADYR